MSAQHAYCTSCSPETLMAFLRSVMLAKTDNLRGCVALPSRTQGSVLAE